MLSARPIRNRILLFSTVILMWIGQIQAYASDTPKHVRLATLNASLYRSKPGQLKKDLQKDDDAAAAIAGTIQSIRPDILLLNEFDYDDQHESVRLFLKHYLAVSKGDTPPMNYRYYYTAPVNTGVPSGCDLDKDGQQNGPGDALGYGQFPGQYGMVVFSQYPIDPNAIRTFQTFLWKDMPGALLPDDPDTAITNDWYTQEELTRVRLSSKSHWDIPVHIGDQILHVLASHPTPPVFDGPEDRNGRRNHDEIRFWADYISPRVSAYIYDDRGRRGGLQEDSFFVVMGDMNADPQDGDSTLAAIQQLLRHPRVKDPLPASSGSSEASATDPEFNAKHQNPPQFDTFQSEPGRPPGNLRLDYVLPSSNIKVLHAGVVWPEQNNTPMDSTSVTDHRMVYVDIEFDRWNK